MLAIRRRFRPLCKTFELIAGIYTSIKSTQRNISENSNSVFYMWTLSVVSGTLEIARKKILASFWFRNIYLCIKEFPLVLDQSNFWMLSWSLLAIILAKCKQQAFELKENLLLKFKIYWMKLPTQNEICVFLFHSVLHKNATKFCTSNQWFMRPYMTMTQCWQVSYCITQSIETNQWSIPVTQALVLLWRFP